MRKRLPQSQAAALANERAATLEKEAAEANESVSNATLEIERLKASNLALEKLLAQRRVFLSIHPDKKSVYDDMRKFKGTTVLLQVVPDFEAKKLAIDIWEVLSGMGFNLKYVQSNETHFKSTEIWDGVSVHTPKAILRPSKVNTSISAGRAISNWLDATGVNPLPTPVFDDLSPESDPANRLKFEALEDVVLVTVGLKPVAAALGKSSVDIQIVDPNNPIK